LYSLIFNKGYDSTDSHTRSQLKRQDPELFRMIEALSCVQCNLTAQPAPTPAAAQPTQQNNNNPFRLPALPKGKAATP
jgi:hypothetical protein